MLRSLSNHLKKDFADYRVSVRRVRASSDRWGDCSRLSDGSYQISISREIDEAASTVILLHEWAHVLSWETDKDPSEHGRSFGLAYSKVYKSYLKWVG